MEDTNLSQSTPPPVVPHKKTFKDLDAEQRRVFLATTTKEQALTVGAQFGLDQTAAYSNWYYYHRQKGRRAAKKTVTAKQVSSDEDGFLFEINGINIHINSDLRPRKIAVRPKDIFITL